MSIDPGANSIGTQVNRYLDSLGLPDTFGDKIGALVDLNRGDLAGFQRNLFDLNSGLSTTLLDRLTGARGRSGFGRAGVLRRAPGGVHLHRWSRTYVTRTRVGRQAHVGHRYDTGYRSLFGGRITGRITGRMYRGSFRRPIRLGRSGYLYRGKMYKNLSAIRADLADGRADGVATRRHTVSGYRLHRHTQFRLAGLIGRSFTPGWNPLPSISKLFGAGGPAGLGGAQGATGASGAGSTQSVLSNPNLSLEDKLMLLMAKLSKHMDKQIEDKMKQIENAMQKKSGKGGGGIFGKLGGLFKTAGAAIGTAFGGPLGGMVGSAVGGAVGSAASGATGGAGKGGKKPNLQLIQSQLQSLMQKRQQMFQTMQNIMKSLHDTSMAAVRNLKA